MVWLVFRFRNQLDGWLNSNQIGGWLTLQTAWQALVCWNATLVCRCQVEWPSSRETLEYILRVLSSARSDPRDRRANALSDSRQDVLALTLTLLNRGGLNFMQHALDQVLQLGQFAMLVIAVSVGAILLVSLIDRHPRDKNPKNDRDSKK